MVFNRDDFLDNEHAKMIIHNIIATGEAGIFTWEIDNQEFHVLESMTDYNYSNVNTLREFLETVVFEKDRELALQDLEKFLTTEDTNYESAFRMIDKEDNVRWIFCKGSIMKGNKLGAIMYDVSENNFKSGHDSDTNLINRTTFMRKLRSSINFALKHNQQNALLYMVIENFHKIITQHGYDFASIVLYEVGRMLLTYLGAKDELGRLPYNKFILLLNNVQDIAEIKDVSQKIFEKFKEPLLIEGHQIRLKINIGMTLFPKMSTDVEELIRYSDFAVSRAREYSLNGPVLFNDDLMATYTRDMDIEYEMSWAILNQELYLEYQPQLDLKTNQIIGFEALVRWKNDKLGFVSPEEFIPIAENKGFIISIGHWVQKESIKTIRRWLDMGIEFEKLSINVSSIEMLHSGFKERLLKICGEYQVNPSLIELEITERTLMRTTDRNKDIVDELILAGFKIALDDFGTGYANINSLINFNINTLKLDKSMIDNIDNQRQVYVIKSILEARNYLFYEIVAEGVEDQHTLQTVTELGFDTIQGYYLSKPLSKFDMERFIFSFKGNKM